MKKNNVIQLSDFLKKVEENEAKKVKITHLEVKNYGLIEFVRPRENEMLDYLAKLTKGVDISKEKTYEEEGEESKKSILKLEKENQKIDLKAIIEASEEFVYKCCPLLQAKEVRDKYSTLLPYKIPTEIWGANTVMDLAKDLNDIFDGSANKKELIEEIKN